MTIKNSVREAIDAGILIVTDIAALTGATREETIRDMKRLEKRGQGHFICGRKGHPSRFEKYQDTGTPAPMRTLTPTGMQAVKMTAAEADLVLQAIAAKYAP